MDQSYSKWKFVMGLAAVVLMLGGGIISEVSAAPKKSQQSSPPIPPSWSQILDSTNGDTTAGREGCDSDRFTCVFNDTAVLDNETGLVWERSPGTTPVNWYDANNVCIFSGEVGGRKGWHLPMIEQLQSLVDTSNSFPALPTGHPFLTVGLGTFWSATTGALAQNNAVNVDMNGGGSNLPLKPSSNSKAWCVRGGQSFDGNTHNTLH